MQFFYPQSHIHLNPLGLMRFETQPPRAGFPSINLCTFKAVGLNRGDHPPGFDEARSQSLRFRTKSFGNILRNAYVTNMMICHA